MAGAEHHQCHGVKVVALFQELHARGFVAIGAFACAEHLVTLQHILVDIDHDIAIHVAAVVAAAIDIAAHQSHTVVVAVRVPGRVTHVVNIGNLHKAEVLRVVMVFRCDRVSSRLRMLSVNACRIGVVLISVC